METELSASRDTGTASGPNHGANLQMALTRLGLFALETVDAPALIDESLREVAQQLGVQHGLVFKLRPDEEDACALADVGFSEDIDDETSLPIGDGTLVQYVIDTRQPVVVTDWAEEERFEQPALFEEHDIVGSAAVAISGRDKPFGVLCACDISPRSFSKEETQFLKTTATIISRTIELRQAERDRLTADHEGGNAKERFRTLAESIPQQVWSTTSEGELNFVNNKVLKYMRKPAQEILDAGWFELMHPDDRAEAETAWRNAQETGETFEAEFRLPCVESENDYCWFLSRAVPMKERNENITAWYGTNTDITRQKENAIEYRRLAAVVENASDFVGAFTLDGRVRFLNEAGRAMVGLAGEEAARQNEFADFHTDDEAAFLKGSILPTVREKGRWQGEFALQHFETGDKIPVDADLFLTHDPSSGEEEYIIAVYRDITSYKKAQKRAEEANRTKSEFLANMSHELRTPLNAVIGYSEMIREDLEDTEPNADAEHEQLIDDLGQIHTAGEQLLSMVNDVLDISKIEAGEMELHTSRFDVREMIEQTGETIRPLVNKNDNKFVVECPDDIGVMHTDRTKLRQGLFNLLGNAAKFTEDGRITLRVRREEVEEQAGIAFEIEDTGIGMNEEDKAEVFEAFQQADTSLTREHEGTGLGLVITRNFCKLMGGDVTVESEKGVGSTFTIHLPRDLGTEGIAEDTQESDASLEIETGETAAQGSTQEDDGSTPDRENENVVLIIDDDERARELVGRHLNKEGFEVVAAANGDEALAKARQLQPTVITLDVMMPEKDGWSVLAALKNDDKLRNIPVVMVTIVDDENMGYMLGASDYLTKPLNAERLTSVLKQYREDDAGQTVMVVEDNEATRDLVRRTLDNQDGYTVYTAQNGREALDELEEGAHPDLILLDLIMPEMDGFTFLDKKEERAEELPSIPIIVMTAKELTAGDRERLNKHVETVLEKGDYNREELLKAVGNRVERMTPNTPQGRDASL